MSDRSVASVLIHLLSLVSELVGFFCFLLDLERCAMAAGFQRLPAFLFILRLPGAEDE